MKRLSELVLAVALILMGAIPSYAVSPDEEAPALGRPSTFTGGVGDFTMYAEANPTTVGVGEPILLTVHATAHGPVRRVPARIDLTRIRALARDFLVEDLPVPAGNPSDSEWRFQYWLRPRGASVHRIPPVRLDFYKPGIIPVEKGFRAVYSAAIPLSVRPPQMVSASDLVMPHKPVPPQSVLTQVEDPKRLLRREPPYSTMSAKLVGALLVLLPVAIALALNTSTVKRRYGRHRGRVSKYAHNALADLAAADSVDAVGLDRCAGVVKDYLREEYALVVQEPAVSEIESHLRRCGCDEAFIRKTARFFRLCELARFSAAAVDVSTLRACAQELAFALVNRP